MSILSASAKLLQSLVVEALVPSIRIVSPFKGCILYKDCCPFKGCILYKGFIAYRFSSPISCLPYKDLYPL